MTIDGDIEVSGDEAAFLKELVSWLHERGASYSGYLRAYSDSELADVEGTFDWPELLELAKVEAVI